MSALPPPRLLALYRHPLRTWLGWALLAALPLVLQPLGLHWVRVADVCLLYVLLALGMNVVVGFAGLLDLGFVAFYAVGAYLMALMTSPHLPQHFAWAQAWFPGGMHAPWWLTLPAAAALAAVVGMLLGLPTLKLRGDYLAVVTLGFGEIVRILIVNLYHPVNITDGAQGIGFIDPLRIGGWHLNTPASVGGLQLAPVTLHYYLFLALVLLSVGVCLRLQRSRIGRAWMAIREDEMAAQAMGLHTRNLKLLAFAVGAAMGGVGGALFGAFQGFVSPEAFSLQESVMIVAMVVFGGMGHVPGVILGAVLLSALPEALRYVVGPLQVWSDGRLDAGVLRPALIGLVMVVTMLVRPRGLWPSPHTASSGVAAGLRSTNPAGDRAPRP
jgi:branched-chain amino acid transport system permease protein